MSEACPKCGAVVREDHDSYRRFACMALELDEVQHLGMHYKLRESVDCLRRQLAQRDERIGELEAWKERWEPVIEAANRMRNAIEDSAWRGRFRYQVLVFDRAVRTAKALEEADDE